MKLGISITAFREKDIVPIIEQYQGIADRIVVTVSSKPWFGNHEEDDTAVKAVKTGAVVINKSWGVESEQRNEAMDLLRDMDYVITSHCDTWFTKQDLLDLKEMRLTDLHYTCHVYTYWRNYDTVIFPHLSLPTILVRSDAVFTNILDIRNQVATPTVLDIACYHVSWVKTDEEVLKKIQSYSHAPEISREWYTNVWKSWRDDMTDFAPTIATDFHTTKKYSLPAEIRSKLL